METKERLDLLLSLTSISSDPIKEALTRHFVQGFDFQSAAELAEIKPSNLQRAITKLEKVERIVHQIEDIDFAAARNRGASHE